MNQFYKLPFHIIRRIYEFDPTDHAIHANLLTELIWYSLINQRIIELKLIGLFSMYY